MDIKKFNENNDNNKKIYLFIYNFESYDLFPDFESAENELLEIINLEKRDIDNISDEELYFVDADTAINWHEEYHGDVYLSIEELTLRDKYEGSEKLKFMKSTKKYNL